MFSAPSNYKLPINYTSLIVAVDEPATNDVGCQTMIQIALQGPKAYSWTGTLFFANVHGVAKSTMTSVIGFCNIAIGTFISTISEGTSTIQMEVSNQLLGTDDWEINENVDRGISAFPLTLEQATQFIIADDGSQSKACDEEREPQVISADVCSEETVPERPRMQHKSTSVTSLPIVNDPPSLAPEKTVSDSIPLFQPDVKPFHKTNPLFSTLYRYFGLTSTHVQLRSSVSDSEIWNRNSFPYMKPPVKHFDTQTIDKGNKSTSHDSSKSTIVFQSAEDLLTTDQYTQTEAETETLYEKPEEIVLSDEEIDVDLAWEVLETAAKVTEKYNEGLSTHSYILHSIPEESESEYEILQTNSTERSHSSPETDRTSNPFTPTASKSAQTIRNVNRTSNLATRSYSESDINKANPSSPMSLTMGLLEKIEGLSCVSSKRSALPTIEAEDSNVEKIKAATTHPKGNVHGDQSDAPMDNDSTSNLVPKKSTSMEKNGVTALVSAESSDEFCVESFTFVESASTNVEGGDNETLTSMTDLLHSTSSTSTSLGLSDSTDCLLTASLMDILDSDTESTLTA